MKLFPYGFFKKFYHFGSESRSLIHFELIFCVCCKIRVHLHSCECGYPVFPAPFVEETILSTLRGLSTLVEDHLTIFVRVYF